MPLPPHPGERINHPLAKAYGQVDVGELRPARVADKAQFPPPFDPFALFDREAAPAHVAILGFPAAAVDKDQAVAAFPPLDGTAAGEGEVDVLHTVAHGLDNAGCRRHPVDALGHHG